MGSCVAGAIPLAVVGLNRRTNSFVMCGSSALGHGGTSATAMRCWHFAAPSITGPSLGYLNAIDSDCERRKNHRMLLSLSCCHWVLARTSVNKITCAEPIGSPLQ